MDKLLQMERNFGVARLKLKNSEATKGSNSLDNCHHLCDVHKINFYSAQFKPFRECNLSTKTRSRMLQCVWFIFSWPRFDVGSLIVELCKEFQNLRWKCSNQKVGGSPGPGPGPFNMCFTTTCLESALLL